MAEALFCTQKVPGPVPSTFRSSGRGWVRLVGGETGADWALKGVEPAIAVQAESHHFPWPEQQYTDWLDLHMWFHRRR